MNNTFYGLNLSFTGTICIIGIPEKVDIFVEGASELSLVKRLVQELCGLRHVTFELVQQFRRTIVALRMEGPQNPPAETYVLIADCSQDGQVLTQIRERYDSLVESGYEAIIGLRDLYPKTLADLPRAQAAINAAKPNGPVPVAIHFALTETEAWYLDEHTHFERIAPTLSLGSYSGQWISDHYDA